MKTLLLSFCFTIALFTISADAQSTETVLIRLPKAVNPADGYHLGGTVHVRVSVNEQGEVSDAQFVSGPGAVCGWVMRPDVTATREAAIALARQAKFAPATNGGAPVASSTIMSIEFAASRSKQPEKAYVAAQKPAEKIYTVKGDVVNDPPTAESTKTDTQQMTIHPDPSFSPKPALVDPDERQTISGGVLNGKAMSLPKPRYPAAARAVRATGAVQVQVLIDEDGNVFLAQAVGGHPLLQSASVIAACDSKFSPTLLAGQPVKVSGIITYNFVP